jgi:hypothetical protein
MPQFYPTTSKNSFYYSQSYKRVFYETRYMNRPDLVKFKCVLRLFGYGPA